MSFRHQDWPRGPSITAFMLPISVVGKAIATPGDPADAILGYLKGEGIPMLVIPTNRRGSPGRVVFTSVVGNVLRSARVPLLVIRSTA